MADFSGFSADESPQFFAGDSTDGLLVPMDVVLGVPSGGGGGGGVVEYLQRIYDTGLAGYVYYTRESVDPTTPPIGVSDTQPNNTGALNLATHSILAEV